MNLYSSPSRMFRSVRAMLGVDLVQFRGFLIDGDHAIRWREGVLTRSLERSVFDIASFFASHSYLCWYNREHCYSCPYASLMPGLWEFQLYTAADDLESFLWVLVWSIVCIFLRFITNPNSQCT